jgi:hypothetical protein
LASAVPVASFQSRFRGFYSASDAVLLGVVVLALAWSLYVFADSQVAYVVATVASMSLAIAFVLVRSPALVALLVAEAGLLGTDANGELARGNSFLGSFRLFDLTLASAVVMIPMAIKRGRGEPHTNKLSAARHRGLRELIQKHGEGAIVCAVLCYAMIVWLLHGHRLDQITKADIRVIGLGLAMWIIARYCIPATENRLPLAMASLGPPLTAKALAIYLSGLWVIGSNDRLQATADYSYGHTRIILVGGDTLLILVPAIAAIALTAHTRLATNLWLWCCVVASFIGLFISGTRSGLIVALLMVGFVTGLRHEGFRMPTRRAALALVGALILLIAGLTLSGEGARFITPDAPHVGINFRIDELRSILRLPMGDLLAGQGIGGRFLGKDVAGHPIVSGWSHALLAWIVLKVGLIGLLALTLLFLYTMWHHWSFLWRCRCVSTTGALGGILLAGVLTMSLTLGRAALAEGAILVGLSIALLRHARDIGST